MTHPSVVASSTFTSVDTSNNILPTLPDGILKDDLLMLFWAERSGGGPTRVSGSYGLRGWHQIHYLLANDLRTRICYKIAHGNESLTTVELAGQDNSGHCVAMIVIRGADIYVAPHCGNGASAFATTNPDAPSRTAPWGSADNLFVAFAGGVGSTAITGTPVNGDAASYIGNIRLSAVTTNAVALALDWTARTTATENPTAWTRASSSWNVNTIVVRPAQPATHAVVKHYSVQNTPGSGATRDVTVHVEGGANTRLLLGVVADELQTANTLTVTLDPDGYGIVMSLVEDTLGTDAETDQGGGAGVDGIRWYTTLAAQGITPGDYTLRQNCSSWATLQSTVHWFEIGNTPTGNVAVVGVCNVHDTTSGAAAEEGTITAEVDGLVLALVDVGALDTWSANNCTIGGVRPAVFGECGESEVYVSKALALVGRCLDGSNTIHVEFTGNSAYHFSAIALGYVPPPTGGAPGVAPLPLRLTQGQLDQIVESRGGSSWLGWVKSEWGVKIAGPDRRGFLTVIYPQ